MGIRKLELIAALQKIPGDPIVTIWDDDFAEDVDIRRVMLTPGDVEPGDVEPWAVEPTAIIITPTRLAPRTLNVLASLWEEG
jgi:hypothetical protein